MCNLFQISKQRELDKMKSSSYKKIGMAFLAGTLVALVLGVLFAPKSGKDLRKQIVRTCKIYRKTRGGELYVGNVNSDVFHLNSCVHLPNSDNRIVYRNRDEAIASGKTPCQSCNP